MSKWHFIHNSYMLTCHDLGISCGNGHMTYSHISWNTTDNQWHFIFPFAKTAWVLVISYIDTEWVVHFHDHSLMISWCKQVRNQYEDKQQADSLPMVAFKDTALHFSSWTGTIECVPPVSKTSEHQPFVGFPILNMRFGAQVMKWVLLLLKSRCVYENGFNPDSPSDPQILFNFLHRRVIGPKSVEFHVASTMEEQVDLLRKEPMCLSHRHWSSLEPGFHLARVLPPL